MTGARLLVVGGPDTDASRVAASLTASGRECFSLAREAVVAGAPRPWTGAAVVSLAGLAGPDPLPELLDALEGWRAHCVFLADAAFTPPDTVRVLRGLDAPGIGAVLDILADRDEATRRADIHQAWHNAFLAGFPGVVMLCDAGNAVVSGNAALFRRAGTDPVGLPCFTAMHGRAEPCPWCALSQVLSGRTISLEIQSPLDGRYFFMASAPFRIADNPPLALTLLVDVTDRNMALARLKALNRDLERRVAERTDVLSRQAGELAEANNRLLELDALKSGFLATVTHDLRTPLTSVLGFAKLTRREFLKEFMQFADVSERLWKKGTRIADNLRIIENEGSRLTRLVNDFLDLSKIESGRLDWHDRDIDPVDVVRAAVAAVGAEYEQNEHLSLVVDVPGPLPSLRLDPDRLIQVLVNLLTNAARHAGEGDVTLTVRDRPRAVVEFRVADSGPGIPEEERERIFDKFYQVRQGDTTDADRRGTGLGLAICKQIVERYGGRIRVEAAKPRGSVFVVELPARPSIVPGGGPQRADERGEEPAPS